MSSKYFKDLVCVSLLTLAVIIVFFNTIFFGADISRIGTVAHRDTLFGRFAKGNVDRMDTSIYQEHGPNYFLTEKIVSRGVMPFWNPYSGLGMDLWGDAQALVLSPLTWINAPFFSSRAYSLTMVLTILLAAWGAYGLARVLRLSAYAALFTALVVTFNPYLLYMNEWTRGHIHASMLPFLGFALMWRRGDGLSVLLAALGCSASVISGHAVPVFYSIFLASLLYLTLNIFAPQKPRHVLSLVRNYLAAGLLCFLFSAPLVVPFLFVVKNSDCFKADIPNIYYTVRATALLPSFFFPFQGAGSPYFGPSAILLLLSGFFLSFKNKAIMWSVASVAIFTLAMMIRLGPFDWIGSLPYINWFMPIYALPYLCLLMAILIGCAFDGLAEQKKFGKPLILVSVFAALALSFPFIFQSFDVSPKFTRLNDWLTEMTVNRSILMREMIFFALTVITIYAIHKVPEKFKKRLTLILILVNSVSLAFLIRGSLPAKPLFSYEAVDPIPFLAGEKQRTISMGRHVLVPNTSQIFSVANLLFFAPTYPKDSVPFLKALGITIEGVGQYAEKPFSRLIDIASVKYAIATEPVLAQDDFIPPPSDIGVDGKGIQYSSDLLLKSASAEIDTGNSDILGSLTWRFNENSKRHYAFLPLLVNADASVLWMGDRHSLNALRKDSSTDTFTTPFSAVIPTRLRNERKAGEKFCLHLQVIDLDSGKLIAPSGAVEGVKLRTATDSLILKSFEIPEVPNALSPSEHHRHFKLVSETTPELVRVYENTQALPPAYFVYDTRLAKDIDEACRVMTQQSYDPRKTACVESPEALLPEQKNVTYEDVKVEFSRPDVNSVEIKLVNKTEGLLVVSETFFPGWTCTDNGKEVTIYKANGVMRGLKLSPGSHDLKMTYLPAGLKVGFILWAIGILLAVFLLMKMRKTN